MGCFVPERPGESDAPDIAYGTGAATAAVLAVTAIAPSVAAPPDERAADRPLTGSVAAGPAAKPVTLTLVTGDRVLVTTDASGASAATALPRPDGTTPLLQTRQSGSDLYVYPEAAVAALARGTVDEELFNVTGLIRQGYDDSGTDSVPLIATYTADTAPLTPRGAERGQALHAIDGLALKADKKRTADFWADLTAPRSRSGAGLKKLWLDRKVRATLDRSTQQVGADRAWAAGYDGTGTKVAVLDTGPTPGTRTWTAGSPPPRTSPTPPPPTTSGATAPMSPPPSAAPARRVVGRTRGWPPVPTSWWARS